jgi:Protein of unknown function (DUF1173)
VPAYLFHDQRLTLHDARLFDALGTAHKEHGRPLCLCMAGGVQMYVARLGPAFILKRMPGTGSLHAPDCASYEPPAELSGLGQVIGTAIAEDPESGTTSLKLGFALSKNGARPNGVRHDECASAAVRDSSKLTLRGLLHYLWDQAELTRWQPTFAGRRTWATVRRLLLIAAEGKVARGRALQDRLYVPEVFDASHREEIAARQMAQWTNAMQTGKRDRPLMVMIGEVKEIARARFASKAVVKHVPDQAFALSDPVYRDTGQRFERELSLWGAIKNLHMVMIATFGANAAGVPTIEELSLMPVNAQWIPVEDVYDLQLVDHLLRAERRFVKCLRCDVAAKHVLPRAVLLDTPSSPSLLYVTRPGADHPQSDAAIAEAPRVWVWHVTRSQMPVLPSAGPRQVALLCKQ